MEKEAGEILPKAALYVKEITDPGYTSVYYLATARYYQLLQEYEKAIGAIDTTLQLDYSIADKIDSTYSSYEALLSLCRYYCNTYKLG